jgi:hypothetical protein
VSAGVSDIEPGKKPLDDYPQGEKDKIGQEKTVELNHPLRKTHRACTPGRLFRQGSIN